MSDDELTYAAAGVDIDSADEAIARLAPHARSTFRPEVLSDIGSFGALMSLPSGYESPVLVSSTDGAGTKTLVATAMGRFDTIGIDVVAMCVDDLVCLGAEPLLFNDLVTTGRVDPDHIEELVVGLADGCRQAGCSLIGGEIAEHPDAMGPADWDIGGFAVGVVDRHDIIDGPSQVRAGDRLVGLSSPGLRCNGYSLARRVLLAEPSMVHQPAWSGAEMTIGDELLRPSVIYALAVLDVIRSVSVHGVAHITGGGLPGNLVRVLSPDLDAVVQWGTWEVPAIFGEIERRGGIATDEMARVFNLGIGMVLIVPPDALGTAVDVLDNHGHTAVEIGEVVNGSGLVKLDR